MVPLTPSYIHALESGRLKENVETAFDQLRSCNLCPRRCAVDRIAGDMGVCNTARKAVVASYSPHFGEEAALVGHHGSGTIFFTHCNLLCNFCQNYDISHQGSGVEIDDTELAEIMLSLQKSGCHNINFVTPSHVVPQILAAVELAAKRGLRVPLIFNTSGYDRVNTLSLLDGVVDIYMPDFKFWDPKVAAKTCDAPDYPVMAQKALKEMHRQVGDLVINEEGLAERGVLIRHLVLPHNLAGTEQVMTFIAQELSPSSYVNIMFQYRPCGNAHAVKELADCPSKDDFYRAVQAAKDAGIERLDRPRRVFVLH
jgi:putative pyruvate formate lyase activating enzyme